MASNPISLAYYCSGHGYGHATRVSAFARHLLSVKEEDRPFVYIVSSAPEHVFSDSIACGARYRYAEIDPVIVQPLAYRVDRRKSVEVLKKFLLKKDELLERERQWLLQINAHCVLSDAAFLGCLAASAAGLPSILITNFSFDSVYSYLSTPMLDVTPSPHHITRHKDPDVLDLIPDIPIPHDELAPLVEEIFAGYRCADLLIRLPGYIPIPSFFVDPPLPSFKWIDVDTQRLRPEIMTVSEKPALLPSLPFTSPTLTRKKITRSVIQAPLLVRPPSSNPSVYTPQGRSRLLSSIGVPLSLHDSETTKVLIVSFGGQVIKRPTSSRPSSRTPSRNSSRENIAAAAALSPIDTNKPFKDHAPSTPLIPIAPRSPTTPRFDLHIPSPNMNAHPPRLATPCHIWIPGAPPASKPLPTPSSPASSTIPTFTTIPPTDFLEDSFYADDLPQLLPDASWIAIVCGVSKEQWTESELPDGFYVAPKDVYMPDLTALADVLLGKLGYGTVSECVDACTPFVYVSRPLFIEEHGLRLLLNQEGVGVEMSRQSYEAGDWSEKISEAVALGSLAKERKRKEMAGKMAMTGAAVNPREEAGRELAGMVAEWVRYWWSEGEC
ncbi:hypothetical protein M413DRAFT_446014 [Hebeloma cylindrosporum]|uniref:Uncharacterized protein n=1 Tax=Hebeloma cylindrosporum TaxID=76867 RepID=A0A0C3CAF8_HEBCY|nr:hypothetical protein M413DRAFT_446014 [Hebeloma cylindrosporum h7]